MEMYSVLYKADQRSPRQCWSNQNERSAPVGRKSGYFNCINYSPPIICQKSFMSRRLRGLSMSVKINWAPYYFSADTKLAVVVVQIQRWGSLPKFGADGCCVDPSLLKLRRNYQCGRKLLLTDPAFEKRKNRQCPEEDNRVLYCSILICYYPTEDNAQRGC